MRSTVLIIGFVSFAVLVGAPHLSPSSFGPHQEQVLRLGGSYDDLAPPQRQLVDHWFRRYNEIMGKELAARGAYEQLPVSTRTTFEAVTHALIQTELTDDQGQSLGAAIDLVDQVETVRGKVPNTGGDSQFRVIVLLRPDAVSVLERSQQFSRHHDNTHFHVDYPRNYRQHGVPSIQFSISEHGVRADVDVDYRSAFFLVILFDGHLTAANSDVRAGNNYQRHVNRWSGFMDWWPILFGLEGATVPEDTDASVFEELLPSVPRVDGDSPVAVAGEDFFSSWLVEGTPEKSLAYLAEAAYSCVAEFEPGTESWGMAPVRILRHMIDASEAVGEVTRLEDAIEAVPLSDQQGFTLITHEYSDQFALYKVPSSLTTALMCHSPGRYETMPGRHQGEHFAASFRLRGEQESSKHLTQIWKKDGGYWKVVAFHVEPEAHLVEVPDVRAEKGESSDSSPTDVLEDKSILGPVDELLANWFLGGEIGNVMSHFSESALACVPLLAEEGSNIGPNDHAPTLESWLAEVAKATAGPSSLSDAIQGVQPWHGDLRIFPHPNQDAYVLTSGPDDMVKEFHCEYRQALRDQKSPPEEVSSPGSYYETAFRVRAAGDHAPVFTFLWAREDDAWRVVSFNVLTH